MSTLADLRTADAAADRAARTKREILRTHGADSGKFRVAKANDRLARKAADDVFRALPAELRNKIDFGVIAR